MVSLLTFLCVKQQRWFGFGGEFVLQLRRDQFQLFTKPENSKGLFGADIGTVQLHMLFPKSVFECLVIL